MSQGRKTSYKQKQRERRLSFESLESRQMLSATPYTMESDLVSSAAFLTNNDSLQVDFSTENSQPQSMNAYGGVPDLKAYAGGYLSSSSVVKGKTFDLTTGSIANIGTDAFWGYYRIRVYASLNATISTSDICLYDSNEYGFLSTGDSTSLKINDISTSKLTIGKSYYIGWIISNADGEVVTSNNTAKCAGKLYVAKPTKNLQAYSGGTLSTTLISKGDTFDLETGTVKNIGNTDIDTSFKIKVYASTNATISTYDIFLGEWTVYSGVDAGESISLLVDDIPTNKLTPGKSYYIGWILSGVTGETVTSNNVAKCNAKLTVKSANIQASSGGYLSSYSVLKGDTFNLTTGIIKNIGNDAVKSGYTIKIYASTNATISTKDILLGTWTANYGLNAGRSTTLDINGISTSKLTGDKTYYIGWIITNVNNEVVTSNNIAKCNTKLKVVKPRPNLLAYDGGYLSTTSITRGNRFSLTLGTIKNVGTAATTSSFRINIYASTNDVISSSDILLGYCTVSSKLGVDKSLKLTINSIATSKLSLGKTYYIGWIITGVSGETITSNNWGICNQRLTVKKPSVGTGYYYYPGTFANYKDYTIHFV